MVPIPLLLKAGPTLLRMAGKMFGGKTADVAETAASLLDQAEGRPPKEAEAFMQEAMAKVPEADLLELMKVIGETERVKAEQERARWQAETDQHTQTQETARVEALSEDREVRRTRPGIAKASAKVTFWYVITLDVVFPLLESLVGMAGHVVDLPSADWAVAATLFSPCLAYMGARSAEAFSKQGKTGGGGAVAGLLQAALRK